MKQRAEKPGGKAPLILAVFVLLVVLAGILLPRWLEHPNEKAVKAALRKLREAQTAYYGHWNTFGTLPALRKESLTRLKLYGEANRTQLFGIWITEGVRHGYWFCVVCADYGKTWAATALPVEPGKSGTRKYCVSLEEYWMSVPCVTEEGLAREFPDRRFVGW